MENELKGIPQLNKDLELKFLEDKVDVLTEEIQKMKERLDQLEQPRMTRQHSYSFGL